MGARFEFVAGTRTRLQDNAKFQFARRHTLALWKRRSVATFIPKNACSTLRLSVALDNSLIDADSVNWIHQNNETMNASLSDLITAEYSFVFLRCPYKRLVSAYLDKICDEAYQETNDESLVGVSLLNRRLGAKIVDKGIRLFRGRRGAKRRYRKILRQISFRRFIELISESEVGQLNHHWRPQTDFLIYSKYEDYFLVDEMARAVEILKKKIGFNIVDTRAMLAHSKSRVTRLNKAAVDIKACENYEMLKRGLAPDYKCFFNAEIVDIVEDLYRDDIQLIRERFGPEYLLSSNF